MQVFIDLDGVMADFEGYFASHHGFRHDSVSDAQMWKHIDDHENFFGNLPLMDGAMRMFKEAWILSGRMPIILTACPRTNYERHALAKIDWVHEKIHPTAHVLPVMGGKNKTLFMHQSGDILIDDFEKNIIPWNARGGNGIVHTSIEDTINKLHEIF